METEPPESHDSTPPADLSETTEEPVRAVTTRETTPVWAQTQPVAPAADVAEPASAVGAMKEDPDWSKTEDSSNGDGGKKAPEWARTVPTDPGEAIADGGTRDAPPTLTPEAVATEATPDDVTPPESEATEPPPAVVTAMEPEATEPPEEVDEVTDAPITEPPKAVAADALNSTWPPASESSPAPPEETDIWPPEPPTEHAMPAWPPSAGRLQGAQDTASEAAAHGQSALSEQPEIPAQAIPSWPDSFDSVAPTSPAQPPAPAASRLEPTAAPAPPPAPPAPTPPATSVSQPPSAVTPAPNEPITPAQPGLPSRPAWAPQPTAAPGVSTPPQTKQASVVSVPAWAPRVPLAAEPGTPTWFSPKEQIPHTTAQPVSQPAPAPQQAPAPPVEGGQLPVAKIPPTPAHQPAQPAQPTQPAQSGSAKPTWEVVDQPRKSGPHGKAEAGPTAEDRSYAEWFAWAKRGGAPASACHAAAQGAFKALSSGKDVTTAVQWATAAMSRPPENVSYTRQTYCAWFSLANIDLNLDQHRAHAFAMAAIQVLDMGQDAAAAHAA